MLLSVDMTANSIFCLSIYNLNFLFIYVLEGCFNVF